MTKKRARLTEDNDPLTGTDEVIAGLQQFSQSTSQPAKKAGKHTGKAKTEIKQASKLTCRKVTFQIDESVVEQLDRLHLQMQLDLGKANTPYKEVIVEEAISVLLGMAEFDREGLLESLQERQRLRK